MENFSKTPRSQQMITCQMFLSYTTQGKGWIGGQEKG